MANPEHLAILERGVGVWNQWREENPEVKPDLRLADLRGVNLRAANLSGAYLSETDLGATDLSAADLNDANLRAADLRGANLGAAGLSRAYLGAADLRGVNLREAYLGVANLIDSDLRAADLRGANLRRADLSRAYLIETDLSGADLIRANLIGTDLRAADLKNAKCSCTIFANVDLSETKGLETVKHSGPSTLGIDTLYESKGNIPEVFLRGCGVPDQLIEYARSLMGSPIEYYSCFISYSSKDENFAQRLHNDLQASGVRCWLACEDMKIGDEIRTTIDESIRVHDKLLIILSRHSVGSEWVKDEVEHAIDLEKERKQSVLFPVRIDDTVMESKTGWSAKVRRQRHIGDFTQWKDHDAYSKAFDRLLRDLKAG